MIFASTFLSHSSRDKLLAEAVAKELGRRGVLAWLDRNELEIGDNLSEKLANAIKQQTTVTIFLSPEAANSEWVRDELQTAIDVAEEGGKELLLPIYLGDPLKLVRSVPALKQRWIHPKGDRVTRLGEKVDWPASVEDRTPSKIQDAAVLLAERLAKSIFARLKMPEAHTAAIILDQRGTTGRRTGKPQIPVNLNEMPIPCLVFRQDQGEKTINETLSGADWMSIASSMSRSVRQALSQHRLRELYICGEAQLGLHHLMGWIFDRTSRVDLYCIYRNGDTFSNSGQVRETPPSGGDGVRSIEDKYSPTGPLAKGVATNTISLCLMALETYVIDAANFVRECFPTEPVIWRKTDTQYTKSEEAMQLVADVVALVTRLRLEHSVQRIRLFTALPSHIVPLLAANLTVHVIPEVIFMELNKGVTSPKYVQLPMTFDS